MVSDGLFELLEKAKKDSSLRKRILETKKANDPELALCELATELGCAVTVGQIYEQGQRYLDDLQDGCLNVKEYKQEYADVYDQFFASIEGMENNKK